MTSQPRNGAAIEPELPRLHRLKTDPEVYQAVLAGRKTFEIRLNDRDFRVGDELLLMETTATGEAIKAGAPLQYTGNELRKRVSHVLSGYGLMPGWVCLSFERAAIATHVAKAPAARDVIAERERQVSAEGWTPEHDDEHNDGSIARAAACYAAYGSGTPGRWELLWMWPGDPKVKDARSNLVRAGALILAEIERLDRAAADRASRHAAAAPWLE